VRKANITAKTAKGVGFGFELCAHFCANAGRYFINIAGAAKKYSRVFSVSAWSVTAKSCVLLVYTRNSFIVTWLADFQSYQHNTDVTW